MALDTFHRDCKLSRWLDILGTAWETI
ncbi:MAG: hypothetical protein JWP03_2046, partial [Phycisphaerales bacterium]|nr:hypothetical protein [Phycisphaerales bacterium]